jgi:prophage regulatory protein
VTASQEQEQHLNHYTPTRLLTVPQFLERKGGSRSSLYEMMNPDSERFDPDHPEPIKVGRRTFFVEEEVEAWLRLKIEQSRARRSNRHP